MERQYHILVKLSKATVHYILVEVLTLLLRVCSCVLLEVIKMSIKDINFQDILHSAYPFCYSSSSGFKYLLDFFPKLFEAKVKHGVGPQIKNILEHKELPKNLTKKTKADWSEHWTALFQWLLVSWSITGTKTM